MLKKIFITILYVNINLKNLYLSCTDKLFFYKSLNFDNYYNLK
jgi:hypothetical protein